MFKNEYPEYFGIFPFQVFHITQIVLQNLKFYFKKIRKRITLHDSCRLGRLSGIFEEPRHIIQNINGVELCEMEHTGMHALCCGANGWMNCYNANKQIQRTRIKEAISVSADILVTTCPKCQIHLKCANAIPDIQENLEIKDITKLIVEAIC